MGTKNKVITGVLEILHKHKVLEESQVKELQGAVQTLGIDEAINFLIDQGLVDDINVLRALGEYFQVPSFDVIGYFFDHNLLHKFPKDVLLRNQMIPLEVDENIMIMVVAHPDNQQLLPIIGSFVSYDVQFKVGLARHIDDAIKEYYDTSLTQEAIAIDEAAEHIKNQIDNAKALDDDE